MSEKRTVLVTGATGQQGGAVARALIAAGHAVKALTRTPQSPAAGALARLGAAVVAGDFRAAETLPAALAGVDTVFAMATPFEGGPEDEIRQGTALIDAVRDRRGIHLIYSSVASADRDTGIPHFDSKHVVERALAGAGLDYTIVAPVAFMDNALMPAVLDGLRQGEFRLALPGGRPLQQVAVADIGGFAAALVARRAQVFARRIEIAGDEPTGAGMAAVLTRAIGRPIRYVSFPPAALRAHSEDLARMFEWFDRVGYAVDRKALTQAFPEVKWQSFADWANAQPWERLLGDAPSAGSRLAAAQ